MIQCLRFKRENSTELAFVASPPPNVNAYKGSLMGGRASVNRWNRMIR